VTGRVRAVLAAIALVAATATLGGCGDDAPPADRVPSLARDLERVDAAIVDRDFDRATSALDHIEAATEAAQDDGTLSDSDADRILAAVTSLREALAERPEQQPTESSPTTTSPPPPTSDQEDEGEVEDGENGKGGDGKDKEDKGKEDKGKGSD
jgi:hypothetical protein